MIRSPCASRVVFAAAYGWCCWSGLAVVAQTPDFGREVRPILAEHCWRCHGFDAAARQADLRLDEEAAARKPAESGRAAITPFKPEESELIRRLTALDAAERMPPAESGRPLNQAEVDVLKRWIAGGAEYRRHWAFEPLRTASPPDERGGANPIDAFVAAAQRRNGLSFAPEAEAATLLRRASLDLTGLPPTRDERQSWFDQSYEQTIDRLLQSPALGERIASEWLDAARYADTDGYFGDKPRHMWLWREWVVKSLNDGTSFDRFTIEQLAGDLLPEATIWQKIATGFNRNHMSNDETGLIDEEYRVEYVFDRVDATMSTWLGLTAGCAQCHDHKYDPITQREYYQLFALFNNVPEKGLLSGHNAPPRIAVFSPAQQTERERCETQLAEAERRFAPLRDAARRALNESMSAWLNELTPPPEDEVLAYVSLDDVKSLGGKGGVQAIGTSLQPSAGIRHGAVRLDATQHVECAAPAWTLDGPWTMGVWFASETSLGCPLSRIEPAGNRRGVEVLWQKGRLAVNLVHQWGASAIETTTRERYALNSWHHVVVTYDGSRQAKGLAVFVDGVAATLEVRRDGLQGSLENNEPLRIGRRDEGLGFYGLLDEVRVLGTRLKPEQIARWSADERLRPIAETAPEKRTAADADRLLDAYIDRLADDATRAARRAFREASAASAAARDAAPWALVMEELQTPRATHVLQRGRYDKPQERVEPGIPAALGDWPSTAPRNRLGFAQWLVGPESSLAARVAANRLWAVCFGEGLVRTPNDFGLQGTPPDHPELLDYLALRLRDSGWDWKALLRLIVTSRTYRQQSQPINERVGKLDPENRWFTRGPGFRLSYEMIRDQALAASGLLVRRIGGPSVKPYQPPGLWEEVSYNGDESYEVDDGEGRYRRSLYTYLKRQAPPPMLLLFDGPTREKCTLKRPRTNTPLQSLALLNDPVFWEAARELARQTHEATQSAVPTKSGEFERRIEGLFESILVRRPNEQEREVLRGHWRRVRESLATAPDRTRRVLDLPESTPIDDEMIDTACWTILAHTLLNLDETVVRR